MEKRQKAGKSACPNIEVILLYVHFRIYNEIPFTVIQFIPFIDFLLPFLLIFLRAKHRSRLCRHSI